MSTDRVPGPVVVVGASLAGATTAFTLRDTGYDGELVLVGDEPEPPYERPALSKTYLSGELPLEKLHVRPLASYDEQRVELRLGQAATGVDTEARAVVLASGERLPYGTLVIATGAGNLRPPIPGIDLDGVHQLRTAADADRLRAELPGLRRAVVVGAGFVGCEVTATLTGLGVEVTAVDALPGPLWPQLGPQLSGVVRGWHEERGARLLTGRSVTAFVPHADGRRVGAVELDGGERLPGDLVVVGVGARPATRWLAGTPLHLVDGALRVDASGRSSVPGVYGAGDATATWDDAAQSSVRHEHWSAAIDQGRRVAHAIAGAPPAPAEPPYFWSDQYDHTLQYAGSHDATSRLVVRGDLAAAGEPAVVFFLHGSVLTGVLTIDDGKQLRRAQRLIGRAVDDAVLADPAVDLRQLARAG